MRDALLTYFQGEKNAGVLIAAIGMVTAVAAAVFHRGSFGVRSFAVTLAVLAVVEIAIGVGLYLKTGPQVDALVARLSSDAPGFFADETARMTTVQRNFVWLEVVWLTLIPTAALVAVLQKGRFAVTGIALGLLVHLAVILAFDLVAERRGAVYLGALKAGTAER